MKGNILIVWELTTNTMDDIILKPIGFVKNNVKKPRFGNYANEVSEIIVDKKLTDALNGIDDYSLM